MEWWSLLSTTKEKATDWWPFLYLLLLQGVDRLLHRGDIPSLNTELCKYVLEPLEVELQHLLQIHFEDSVYPYPVEGRVDLKGVELGRRDYLAFPPASGSPETTLLP